MQGLPRLDRFLTLRSIVVGGVVVIAALLAGCSDSEEAARESADAGAAASAAFSTGESADAEVEQAPFSTAGWATDFSRRDVVLTEIFPGGPPRDGIPSIDEPQFVTVSEAERWLAHREPVQVLVVNGHIRAYPTQILVWHEIVNDEIDGVPVAVTYCPLCNTAIVFDRRLPEVGEVELGVSGNLYQSAMVMYDRTTETWFWQVNGTGIVGELTGVQLKMLPSTLTSFREFMDTYPDGLVLSRDTGFVRSYGRNPYQGYDVGESITLPRDSDDPLPAMERVVTLGQEDSPVAIPFSALAETPVVHHELEGTPIVVFYRPGTASPLEATNIVQGRDVGSTAVYETRLDDLTLTFEVVEDGFRDRETGTTWSLLGLGSDGPLAGRDLRPVVHGNHFWFSWVTYRPDTVILRGE